MIIWVTDQSKGVDNNWENHLQLNQTYKHTFIPSYSVEGITLKYFLLQWSIFLALNQCLFTFIARLVAFLTNWWILIIDGSTVLSICCSKHCSQVESNHCFCQKKISTTYITFYQWCQVKYNLLFFIDETLFQSSYNANIFYLIQCSTYQWNISGILCKIMSSLADDYLSHWSIQGGRQFLRKVLFKKIYMLSRSS